MHPRVLALLPALLLPPGGATGEYLSAKNLLELCARHGQELEPTSESELVRQITATATCRGYLMGATDALESDRASGVCVPDETTVGNLLAALRAYAEREPGALARPAGEMVALALRRAHACPAEGKPRSEAPDRSRRTR